MFKKSLYVLLFLQGLNAQADFSDFFGGNRSLSQFAVSDLNVKQASCLSTSPYYKKIPFENIKNHFTKLRASEKIRALTINGKFFQNVRKSYVNLYYDIAGYDRFQMSNSCKDMECEVRTFFGEEYSLKLAYINKQFGFNASYLATHSAGFSEDELDLIIWSFSQLPEFMFKSNLKKIIKDRGYYQNDSSVYASMSARGVLTLYAPWSRLSEEKKVYTLIHEFGHYMGEALGIHNSSKWLSLSDWNRLGGSDRNKSKNFVSQYASDSHMEDFAESFAAYRLNPSLLKKNAPKKYQILKEMVFLGIDYLTNECNSDLIEQNFVDTNFDVSELVSKCKNPLMAYQLDLKEREDAQGCLLDHSEDIQIKELNLSYGFYKKPIIENSKTREYPFLSFNSRYNIVIKLMKAIDSAKP